MLWKPVQERKEKKKEKHIKHIDLSNMLCTKFGKDSNLLEIFVWTVF